MLDEKVTIAYHKQKEIGVQNCSGRNFLETDLELFDIETITARFILLGCVIAVPVNNFFEIFLTIFFLFCFFYSFISFFQFYKYRLVSFLTFSDILFIYLFLHLNQHRLILVNISHLYNRSSF